MKKADLVARLQARLDALLAEQRTATVVIDGVEFCPVVNPFPLEGLLDRAKKLKGRAYTG